MKNYKDVYLEELDGYFNENPDEYSVFDNTYNLMKQTAKLSIHGELIYHLQKDEYQLINWPFNIHFYPQKEELCARSFLKLIHPDDSELICKGKLQVFAYVKPLSTNELSNMLAEFQCKIKTLNGTYQSMFFRCISLNIDKNGVLKTILLQILPISNLECINPICYFQLKNIEKKASIFKLGRSFFPSKRLQVLKLIKKGYCSKDIAKQLNISIHTVNAHRKGILEQTGCENLHGAIDLANEMGLL